jgi:hypothetical protein
MGTISAPLGFAHYNLGGRRAMVWSYPFKSDR